MCNEKISQGKIKAPIVNVTATEVYHSDETFVIVILTVTGSGENSVKVIQCSRNMKY